MQNFTLELMEDLQALTEAGAIVATIAYNPNTVIGDPEDLGPEWTEFYREDTATLVEVILTRDP